MVNFSITKYTKLKYLYISYAKKIDQILIIAFFIENNKNLIEFKHFIINTYSETSITFDYNLKNKYYI